MALFRYPIELIWLAAGFAALVFFYFRARAASQRAALALMAGLQLSRLAGEKALARKKIRDWLYLSALIFLLAAAGGPQWGVEMTPVTDLNGSLVVAVDTSYSMEARDIKPSRMENAKLTLAALADKFQDYRLGIVAFSGDAYVQCPLTTDSDAVKYFLSCLTPGMLPSPGTDISAAIEEAARMLDKYSGAKVLVLITDGEDLEGKVDEALAAASAGNLKIFTVGMGKSEGELIPVADQAGKLSEYKKDASGNTVVTRLNEAMLLKIAQKTGAEYLRYGGNPDATADEIRSTVSRIAMSKTKGFGKAAYKNRYRMPLFLAFLLFLVELMFMERGFSAPRFIIKILSRLRGKKPAALLLLSAAFTLPASCIPVRARAASPESLARKGNDAYNKNNFPKAYEYYSKAMGKKPKDARFPFNRGAAFYRMEDYAKAAEDFEEAAKSPKLKGGASYNAGNAYFKLSDFQKAIEKYRAALIAAPWDKDARHNLQIALEQQKKNSPKCDKPDPKKQQQQPKNKNGNKDTEQKNQEDSQKREEEQKKEAARRQADKLLELMKEKEKSPGNRELMNSRFSGKPKREKKASGKDW
jgi:Ca-activated chloride channel family protein